MELEDLEVRLYTESVFLSDPVKTQRGRGSRRF
jgi:hypothetical protein